MLYFSESLMPKLLSKIYSQNVITVEHPRKTVGIGPAVAQTSLQDPTVKQVHISAEHYWFNDVMCRKLRNELIE